MKFRILIVFFAVMNFSLFAQEKKSKGDNYFYSYQYKDAIAQYNEEKNKAPLRNNQILNLADAYFKTGEFSMASELYIQVNKNDTIMSVHHFNKMLQSLSKNPDKARVKAFLKTKSSMLSQELIENSEFNYGLLGNATKSDNVQLTNLSLNTPQADFSPSFYKENLLFSSSRTQKSKNVYEPTGESYLDIYSGKIEKDGNVITTVPFTKIPETRFHKSTPYFSEQLNRFFYILSNTEEDEMIFDNNGKNALAIGMLYESGQFRFLLKDLSTSFYYPFFDDESERLYFAANFSDSYGGTDLYYVLTSNGQMVSSPVNLGPRINSPGNEIAPYVFNGSLYFSSDVFYGLGGMDIYKSNIQKEEAYSIPVNIGEGINSVKDDFGFIIKENSNKELTGYFSSNRIGGKGGDDIYSFKTTQVPGLKTFALRGKVVNLFSKAGVSKAQIQILDKDGNVLKEIFSELNGDFYFEIPWQKQVKIQSTKNRYSIFSVTYNEADIETVQNSNFNINLTYLDDLLRQEEGKTVFRLEKFFFNKNSSYVNAVIALELDKVVDAVKRFPQLTLKIETHTDSRGSSASNKKLSQNRSNAIKSYLIKNGLSFSNFVETIGYGEEMIKNNCTNGAYCLDFLHKQNERTLIEVIYQY